MTSSVRDASQKNAALDCFVASLLAMTKKGPRERAFFLGRMRRRQRK
jgi:hypothetical protein